METGIHDLTAGYALDALEPEEREAYEAHLPGCARCRDELAMLARAADALAVAATGPAPPGELRGRILAAARTEPQVVVPFEPPRRRWTVPAVAAAAAAAAIVAVALGLWAARLSGDLDTTRSALERQRATAAVLADPAARNVSLSTGAGRLVVDREGRAVLVVHGLEPAPAGKTYELWIVDRGTPVSAGLFRGVGGTDVVGVDGVLKTGDLVAVTIEKSGGTDRPTSRPVVSSSPV